MPPFMNVQTILEEPLKINGIKDKEERYRRVTQVLEEVKMTPAEEFMPNSASAQWRTTAAGCNCQSDDPRTSVAGGR